MAELQCRSCLQDILASSFKGECPFMRYYESAHCNILAKSKKYGCIGNEIECIACGKKIGFKFTKCTGSYKAAEGLFGFEYDKISGFESVRDRLMAMADKCNEIKKKYTEQEERLANCEKAAGKIVAVIRAIKHKK